MKSTMPAMKHQRGFTTLGDISIWWLAAVLTFFLAFTYWLWDVYPSGQLMKCPGVISSFNKDWKAHQLDSSSKVPHISKTCICYSDSLLIGYESMQPVQQAHVASRAILPKARETLGDVCPKEDEESDDSGDGSE